MEILIISLFIICWNLIVPLITGKKSVAYCGLVGFCGDRPGDANLLKICLMYNLERGEDSTGWAINNKITKDSDNVKKFMSKNKIEFHDTDENFTFVAHARKSSSGPRYDKNLAHPFGIYKDGNEKENFDLILAMNGTLNNTQELVDEFKVEYKSASNSDTQVLARIMTKLGEKEYVKALESYDGAATLVFFAPKFPNTLMVYKDPLRPLFYWSKSKTEMYISSMEESLSAIGASEKEIVSFEDNILYRITKGKISKTFKVERKPIKKKVAQNWSNRGYYADYYGEDMNSGGVQQGSNFQSHSASRGNNNNSNNTIDVFKFSSNTGVAKKNNGIYCIADRYHRNGYPLTESQLLDKDGKVMSAGDNSALFDRYYFINGHMIKDEASYKLLKEKYDESGVFSLSKFKETKLSEICEYFMYPVVSLADRQQRFILNTEWSEKIKNKGDTITYTMLFGDHEITLAWDNKAIQPPKDKPFAKVRVCNLISMEEIESDGKFESVVKELVKKSDDITALKIYHRVLAEAWRMNNTDPKRRYFFKKLLKFLLKEDILSQSSYGDLLDAGTNCDFSFTNAGFTTDIEMAIICYRDFLQKDTKVVGTNLNDEDVEEVSIFDRAVATDEKEREIAIEKLKNTNGYFNQKGFQDDVIDVKYPTLRDLSQDWCNNDDIEVRELCEAVVLCMNHIGKLQSGETLELLNKTEVMLTAEVERIYTIFGKDMNRVVVNAETSIEVETLDDYDEEVENIYKDIRDKLGADIATFADVPEDKRSEKFKQINNHYIRMFGEVSQNLKVIEDDHK